MNGVPVTPLLVIRHATGLTGAQVAERIGVAKTTFHTWERGETLPNVAVVPSLSAVLGISVEQLVAVLTGTESSPASTSRPVLRIDLRGHDVQADAVAPTALPKE